MLAYSLFYIYIWISKYVHNAVFQQNAQTVDGYHNKDPTGWSWQAGQNFACSLAYMECVVNNQLDMWVLVNTFIGYAKVYIWPMISCRRTCPFVYLSRRVPEISFSPQEVMGLDGFFLFFGGSANVVHHDWCGSALMDNVITGGCRLRDFF